MSTVKKEEDDFPYEYPKNRPSIEEGRKKHPTENTYPIPAIPEEEPVKVYHIPSRQRAGREISEAYPEIDTDLARDNLENDLTAADIQDM